MMDLEPLWEDAKIPDAHQRYKINFLLLTFLLHYNDEEEQRYQLHKINKIPLD